MDIPSPAGEELSDVRMRDNPAYQEISRFTQENEPHIYERVVF